VYGPTPPYPDAYTEYAADEAFILKDGKWEKLAGTRVLLANPRTENEMRRTESGWVTNGEAKVAPNG